jgi:hypothetical protein
MKEESNNQLLIEDPEIKKGALKILRGRIEKAIDKKYEGEAKFRDYEHNFYIDSSVPLAKTNDLVNYLIDPLAEKAFRLNETEPLKNLEKPSQGINSS